MSVNLTTNPADARAARPCQHTTRRRVATGTTTATGARRGASLALPAGLAAAALAAATLVAEVQEGNDPKRRVAGCEQVRKITDLSHTTGDGRRAHAPEKSVRGETGGATTSKPVQCEGLGSQGVASSEWAAGVWHRGRGLERWRSCPWTMVASVSGRGSVPGCLRFVCSSV